MSNSSGILKPGKGKVGWRGRAGVHAPERCSDRQHINRSATVRARELVVAELAARPRRRVQPRRPRRANGPRRWRARPRDRDDDRDEHVHAGHSIVSAVFAAG